MALPESELLSRVGAAFIAGCVIGFERESHGRAAGLRTTVLVCVAASMAMIISDYLSQPYSGAVWHPDPARLGAGVLTGMGFLGAGSIIRQENMVRGVTTAATLWFVTMVGLAFGSGYFVVGAISLGMAMLILFMLPMVETWVKNDWYATVTVTAIIGGPTEDEIRGQLLEAGVKVKNLELEYDLSVKQKVLRYDLKFKKTDLVQISQTVVQRLMKQDGIVKVKWM